MAIIRRDETFVHDLRYKVSRVHSCGEDWRSSCRDLSCSTRAIRELPDCKHAYIFDLSKFRLPSSRVPVPKFKQRYGSVPTTSHHFINSSVPNSFDSVPIQASSGLCQNQHDMIGRMRCGVLPARPALPRTNTVQPMVGSNKVTSRISYDGHIEILKCIDNVFAKAVLV